MNELNLQTVFHKFVHADMRLAVFVVECPGTQFVYVAIVVLQDTIHGVSLPARAASITEYGKSSLPL